MAVNFNGKFKVGGIEHHHPLSSEEIKFLLLILKECKISGSDLDNFIVVVNKLQEEYKIVRKKENNK